MQRVRAGPHSILWLILLSDVGKVKVTVNGLGEKFEDETEISVRPPSTLQKVTGSGSIAGGSSQKVNIGLSDFIPGSTRL